MINRATYRHNVRSSQTGLQASNNRKKPAGVFAHKVCLWLIVTVNRICSRFHHVLISILSTPQMTHKDESQVALVLNSPRILISLFILIQTTSELSCDLDALGKFALKMHIIQVVFIIAMAAIYSAEAELTDRCLGCICHASTKCNRDIGCTDAGVCGPLLITWPFWADAGKFVIRGTNPNSNTAYSDCSNDLYCAGETVKSYMAKYEHDCNGDGVIDCEDYARIHKLGPGNCENPSFATTDYGTQFQQCRAAAGV